MRTSQQVTHFCMALALLFVLSAAALAQGVFTSTVANPGVSDQKAGSVLVFPYYTSSMNGTTDTLITITNVCNGPSKINGADNNKFLHLFFMDNTCAPADTYLCLTPNGSLQILLSNYARVS